VLLVEHGSSHQIEIGKTAAAGGLLLGRYDRCDTNGLDVLHADRVSRVHALILHIDGATYLIDTASTNGVWVGGKRVNCVQLRDGLEVRLAGRGHVLRWHELN